MNEQVLDQFLCKSNKPMALLAFDDGLMFSFILFFFFFNPFWPYGANLGREVTYNGLCFAFVCFWFYLFALDVKLILLIIADLLIIQGAEHVQTGVVRWPFVNM